MHAHRIAAWHVVTGISVITAALVLVEVPRDTWLTTATASLALGASALALMGTAALLGARWRVVESALGGLDRVYLTHKWLAVWALVFASVHLVFQAELKAWDLAPILELPRYTTRLVRQMSFVALMVIVLLALNRKIPYSTWRWWHKLSGPLFLIVILHWLSIRSPIALASPTGVWLAGIATLGVAGAAYKLLLYHLVANSAEYRVLQASAEGSALHLQLEPLGRPISCKPGQFGFLRINEDGLREPHPFTIAGLSPEGHVQFVVRDLGDYTHRLLESVRPGMRADIYAPHGRFVREATASREVWIGGGVGVTPFIAWLADAEARHFDRVTFFYFFTPGREFPRAELLRDLAQKRGAEFVPVSTGPSSPHFTQRLAQVARDADAAPVTVNFCGPKGLLAAVRAQMQANGISEENLHFEYFEFR
jgi:predicted ferric reductase